MPNLLGTAELLRSIKAQVATIDYTHHLMATEKLIEPYTRLLFIKSPELKILTVLAEFIMTRN